MVEHDSKIPFATTKSILGPCFTCFDSYVNSNSKIVQKRPKLHPPHLNIETDDLKIIAMNKIVHF